MRLKPLSTGLSLILALGTPRAGMCLLLSSNQAFWWLRLCLAFRFDSPGVRLHLLPQTGLPEGRAMCLFPPQASPGQACALSSRLGSVRAGLCLPCIQAPLVHRYTSALVGSSPRTRLSPPQAGRPPPVGAVPLLPDRSWCSRIWDFILCSAPELTCSISYPQEEKVAGICDDSGPVNSAVSGPACLLENSCATSDFLWPDSKPLVPKKNGWWEVEVNPSLPRRLLTLGDSEEKWIDHVVHFFFSGSPLSISIPMHAPSHLSPPTPGHFGWIRIEQKLSATSQAGQGTLYETECKLGCSNKRANTVTSTWENFPLSC